MPVCMLASVAWLAPINAPLPIQLCMPEGLLFKKNLKDPQKSTHSFLITRENGSHSYGSVVVFYEQVQSTRVLNTLEALQARYQETRRGGLNSDHDLSFNRTEDSLFATKCICFITAKPVFGPCQAYLEQLYAIAAGEKSAKLPLESYIYNILYEVPFPAPGKCIRFLGPLGRISWRCPSQSELPLCDFSFREFFELLAVRSILKVVTCILLEHQILIKASGTVPNERREKLLENGFVFSRGGGGGVCLT